MTVEKKFFLAVLLVLTLTSAAAADRLTVYTVNYPLAYFAERIGAEQVEVVFPAPDDVDPAYWMPDQATISAYQQADLILLNGANYAKWVSKVSLPRGKMVDTSRKFKQRYIYAADVQTHSHGTEGAHAHESLAFTTWLDFSLAAEQARAVAEAFARKRPEQRDIFQANYTALQQDLLALDSEVKQLVARDSARLLVMSHPVYDYLARAYDLNIRSVHWESDEVPSGGQVNELNKVLSEHPAKWMVWEADPEAESVAKLKARGMESLVFDPCGNVPKSGDYLQRMRQNVNNLSQAYE